MGVQFEVEQAVQGCQDDMSDVTAAAQKIEAAVRAARKWITDETWSGQPAVTWCGDWNSFYSQLLSLLANQLPGAGKLVETSVRTQMQQLVEHQARTSAPTSA